MISEKSVSVLPAASRAVITGCVVNTAPETEPAGCVVKANVVATTSTVLPVLLLMAEVAPIWVPLLPTVKSVSPSTERI